MTRMHGTKRTKAGRIDFGLLVMPALPKLNGAIGIIPLGRYR